MVETATVRAAPTPPRSGATVTRRARTPGRARALVERKVAAVLRALDALGVPRASVRTEAIESYRTRRKGRVRHVAVTSLRIRTQDLDRLGELVGALRGTNLDGPAFAVTDSTAARQEATRIALARARTRADAAAAALGPARRPHPHRRPEPRGGLRPGVRLERSVRARGLRGGGVYR